MKQIFRGLALAGLLLAGACTKPAERPSVELAPPAAVDKDPSAWQSVASAADLGRLNRLAEAWRSALAEARSRGFRSAIAGEGELLEPGTGLPRAAPPPGSYHCRVVKLGSQRRRGAAFTAYKPFFCHVEAEGPLLTIVKQTGSQRPAGRLYPDGDARMVFLGTLALGNQETPLAYGEAAERDMAGVVERVAPFRWRLVIPWPRTESKLDVFELVPAAQ